MPTERYELNGCSVTVVNLWEKPNECYMCGSIGFHQHAVPWYYGPVSEGNSDGGYAPVCAACHDNWANMGSNV